MGWFDSKTTMTKLGQQQGYFVHALGDRMYFLKPSEPTDRAIISAHGGHDLLSTTNTFPVPAGLTLRFYSDDGFSVDDPGLTNFYRKNAVVKETLTGGDNCFDYGLTKYQGAGHNKMGETYDSIAKCIADEVAHLRNFEEDLFRAIGQFNDRAADRLRAAKAKLQFPAVATVRNRRFKTDLTLRMVLNTVVAAAPEIKIFDCLFCRSKMRGGTQAVVMHNR